MENNFTKIGLLGKSFGHTGGIKLKLFDDFLEALINRDFIFLQHDGYFVPYRIVNYDTAKKMIFLSDIETEEKASRLKAKEIFLPTSELKGFVEDEVLFAGFELYHNENRIGTIDRVEEYASQLMAFVYYKGNELMIPVHENLIEHADLDNKKLVMNLPDGLLDL